MKNYKNFITEELTKSQTIYLTTIINYLKEHADFEVYEYGEDFDIIKYGSDVLLTGKLYLIPEQKAVRFNFNKSKLVSIDLWNKFEFNAEKTTIKPDYTLFVDMTILKHIGDIINFINGDFNLHEDLSDTNIKSAPEEDVQLKSIKINKNVFEQDIDVFESIKLYTAQVAFKVSNALVVSGKGGLGKTSEIENTLNEIRADYVPISGDISTAGLYELLFLNHDKLIVMDDIDAVFKDENSINLLKAVLDTKPNRQVSRSMKSYFDSSNMTMKEIWSEYKSKQVLPKQFTFTGRIIFITNKPGTELDPALITRCLFVDVDPSKEDIIKRMYDISKKIQPNISQDIKDSVIEFMVALDERYQMKFELNLRTFVHCLNIRIANNLNILVNGETVPAWLMLIKSYLIKK